MLSTGQTYMVGPIPTSTMVRNKADVAWDCGMQHVTCVIASMITQLVSLPAVQYAAWRNLDERWAVRHYRSPELYIPFQSSHHVVASSKKSPEIRFRLRLLLRKSSRKNASWPSRESLLSEPDRPVQLQSTLSRKSRLST